MTEKFTADDIAYMGKDDLKQLARTLNIRGRSKWKTSEYAEKIMGHLGLSPAAVTDARDYWLQQDQPRGATLRYLSVCSGVGGLDYGLERAGWNPVAFCEAEPYPRSVLRRHWPEVPVFEDMRTLRASDLPGPVDAVVGGIPCQPFSNAGHKRGTDDPRHLWPHFLRLMLETGARIGLIENVRGLLSTQDGQAFEAIVSEAVAAGFTVEWQLSAAGTFGAPHQRHRVCIVLRRDGRWTWDGPAQVGLFGSAPWSRSAPSAWPKAGRADSRGWVEVPQRWPDPAVWPWLVGKAREMLPTPNAGMQNYDEDPEQFEARRVRVAARHNNNGLGLPLGQWAQRRMLPTPTRSVANGAGEHGTGGDNLQTMAAHRMLPTPTKNDEKGADYYGNGGLTLSGAAKLRDGVAVQPGLRRRMLPTPAAHDYKGCSAPGQRRGQLGEAVHEYRGGKLHPRPVEWMMGWPDGWTMQDGPSLRDEPPQTWRDWPACPWTTAQKEPDRRPRLMGCGNGVVSAAAEVWGRSVLSSIAADQPLTGGHND